MVELKVGQFLQNDLNGLKIFNDIASVKTGVMFLEDMKKVGNTKFLLEKM